MAKRNQNSAPDSNADATVEARVLTDCHYGKCNAVIALSVEQIEAGVREGCLDATPEAVAYAKSLKAG